jgi:hypothetical protein
MIHQDSHDQSLLLLVTLGIDYIYYIDFQQEKILGTSQMGNAGGLHWETPSSSLAPPVKRESGYHWIDD